jgi:hypothetical protein
MYYTSLAKEERVEIKKIEMIDGKKKKKEK